MSSTISLKVDREIDAVSADAAHFLGLSKKEFYEAAAVAYIEANREKLDAAMRAALDRLDGTEEAEIALLTGMSRERIQDVSAAEDD